MKLFQYIQGERKGKAINRLEKEAMKDPFLADALEGFDKVTGNDHELRIEEMRAKILHQTQSGNNHLLRYLSIAASILFIIGFGGYFLLNKNQTHTEENIAKVQYDLYVPEKKVIENEDIIIQEPVQESAPKIERQTKQAEKTLTAKIEEMKPATAIQEDVSTDIEDVIEIAEIEVHKEVAEIAEEKIETTALVEQNVKVRGIVTDAKGE
ncbi:MAG: hypothetical protein LBN11_03755, partial [Tannerella sp.]|nr:hypothetical protein [Tannerella sp.]